jgi:hypothetical protein
MFPLLDILNIGSKILDKVIPDPAAKAAAQLKLMELQMSGELSQMTGQMEVNKEEAKSTSKFIAGWRPFIGWVCGSAFAINFVVGPLIAFVGVSVGNPVEVPKLDLTEMMPVLLGMLGLGAYRSFEKVKGSEGNR